MAVELRAQPPAGSPLAAAVQVVEVTPAGTVVRGDQLAREEPLAIRLRAGDEVQTVALTLRTPGHDAALALGFLFAEGVVRDRSLVTGVALGDEQTPEGELLATVEVALAARRLPSLRTLDRHVFTSSACGFCGRLDPGEASLSGVSPLGAGLRLTAQDLFRLPARLAELQPGFQATGGLHAAARFDAVGNLLGLAEDVGRHNAVDKLFGAAFESGELGIGAPGLASQVLLVSGRASFELVQKCVVAGVPVLAAVSAPSSRAVALAARFGLTLVGFLRGERLVVYHGAERLGVAP